MGDSFKPEMPLVCLLRDRSQTETIFVTYNGPTLNRVPLFPRSFFDVNSPENREFMEEAIKAWAKDEHFK